MKGAGHIWLKEEEENPTPHPPPPSPVPQFEPRVRKLFMLDIAFTTVNPLLFYVTF